MDNHFSSLPPIERSTTQPKQVFFIE